MPNYLHRTSKQLIISVAAFDLPEVEANYIEEPDMSAVTGQPSKYWEISGDTVSLADQSTRDAIDAAETVTRLDSTIAQIDQVEDILRAVVQMMLDESNVRAGKMNDVISALQDATSLADLQTRANAISDMPTRTLTQVRTAIRNKLGN